MQMDLGSRSPRSEYPYKGKALHIQKINTHKRRDINYSRKSTNRRIWNRRPVLRMNSVPNFLRHQAHSSQSPLKTTTEAIDSAVMPLFGLSSARSKSTYPFFQPLGETPKEANRNIRQAFPSNIIFRLFECDRLHFHPFTPIIPDLAEFELCLCSYLEGRAKQDGESNSVDQNLLDTSNWRSKACLTSLYAVSASGLRFSKNNSSQIQDKSQLYPVVWQGSLLSLCFDRIPVTRPITAAEDLRDNISYAEALQFLCDRTLRSSSLWASFESPDLAVILGDISIKY
ncbi:hypothetical protein BGAL_0154g00040 [Botrytis galanthina]|uniref:Uncharacterized protein n=1 Tax=Botrytis galanthina TaxID=278940 RepID=A0A4S8R2S0_9HELO|nr:hypothetical protein BGAL_0154g00040 [Botrytis galanthina]